MALSIKYKKSAGIRVTKAAYDLIARGGRARDDGKWQEAAAGFQAALSEDPELAHIWIQLGHVLKEGGGTRAAADAYRRAAEIRPRDIEPPLHLAHLAKKNGDVGTAARWFARILEIDPNYAPAMDELYRLTDQDPTRSIGDTLEWLRTALQFDDADPADDMGAKSQAAVRAMDDMLAAMPEGPDAGALRQAKMLLNQVREGGAWRGVLTTPLIFDVSGLVRSWQSSRALGDVQRMQVHVLLAALTRVGDLSIGYVTDEREGWRALPRRIFREVAELSLAGGSPKAHDWLTKVARLKLAIRLGNRLEFHEDACVVSLDLAWSLKNYFLAVRDAQTKHGALFLPLVPDLAALLEGEGSGVAEDMVRGVLGLFGCARRFLVGSCAAKHSLMAMANRLEQPLQDHDVAILRLNDGSVGKVEGACSDKVGTWTEILADIEREAADFIRNRPAVQSIKPVCFATWYSLAERDVPLSPAAFFSADGFRAGVGWLPPDRGGCWISPSGAELAIGVCEADAIRRMYILLRGLPSEGCRFRLKLENAPELIGQLAPAERKWIALELPREIPDGRLRVHLSGDNRQDVVVPGVPNQTWAAALGVAGFYIVAADDLAARAGLLEAMALGNLDELGAV